MLDLYLTHKGDGWFRARDGLDKRLAIENLKPEARVRAKITQPRNEGHHRLYWKVLSLVCDNTDAFPSTEGLHSWLKIKAGYVDHIRIGDNETIVVPQSTSFAAMDQAAFDQYFEVAMHIIETEVLPGIGHEELLSEALERQAA